MHSAAALLEIHARAHENLVDLLAHCRRLDAEALNREMPGFGYPTVRLQLHHGLGAEKYWIGVLEGRIDVDDDDSRFPTVASLESWREAVFAVTVAYLAGATSDELNTPRSMTTWGGNEKVLVPAHVVMRTVAHLYHHQGQITAMCRLLDHPVGGLDYPHGPTATS